MTKQESAENTLKCHLSIEESSKIGLDVINLAEDNVAVLCNKHVFAEQEPKVRVARVVKKVVAKRSKLRTVTQNLYNLEPDNTTEKSLNIELDLYQMENY